MDTISVSTMVTNVRTRTDKTRSKFVSDAEIVLFLQSAWRELYDVLTNSNEDYNLTVGPDFVLTAGLNAVALPDDFYKLRGVDQFENANWVNVRRYSMQERNRRQMGGVDKSTRYQLRGAQIVFQPPPDGGGTFRLLYVPRAPRLTTDAIPAAGFANEIDAINGYDAFLELKASIQVRLKEEADVSGLTREAASELKRVVEASAVRDAAEPLVVSDVVNFRNEEWD